MNGNDIFNAVRSFDLENTVREIGQEGHILTQTEITALTVTAALGLLLCLFGFKIIRFWAALAGLVLGTAVYYLLPVEGRLIHIALCIVTGIIGLLVQLLLESKRQKKKSLKKAEEIRGERSTANEVERARAMMEELESMPESRTAEEDTAEETKGTETEDQEPSDEK